MRVINVRRIGVAALGGALTVSLAACGSSNNSSSSSSSAAGNAWATAQSATAGGGMDALVAAAKAEGSLNVITLPRDWANYGELMDNFTKKYGIKINDANPDGSSADEITAIKTLKGQDRAPDVVDVGMPFAYSGTTEGLFAPYKVATWDSIPAAAKDAAGNWFNDYGGVMSIGCDAKRVSVCPTSFKQLDNPAYKGMVALKDDPSQANAALMGVAAVALSQGGSLDNVQPGIDYFGKLKKDGIFKPIKATESTVENGATPILIFWDYLNASYGKSAAAKGVDWKVTVPTDSPVLAGYYAQAINANAPHPAAARLWEEYLFSIEGQNGFLKGGAHPVEQDAMVSAGTINKDLLAALPKASGTPVLPNEQQNTTIGNQVSAGWAKALG